MKRTHRFSPSALLILSMCLLLVGMTAARATPELTVGNYQLVNSKRLSRFEFEYTYKADITNTGSEATGVSATLTVNAPGVTVLDASLDFGSVKSGARVTSSDTFALRQNRQHSFGIDSLKWELKATAALVPPADPQVIEIGSGADAIAVNTKSYEGQVELPPGVGPTLDSLHVESGISGSSPISADGRFTARMNSNITTLLSLVDAGGRIYMLKLFPKADEFKEINPVINSRSTAVALIALEPGLLTADPWVDSFILGVINGLPETEQLSVLIDAELNGNAFRIGDAPSATVATGIRLAREALSRLILNDFLATSLFDKFNRWVAKLGLQFMSLAHADTLATVECIESFSERFTGNKLNADGVCINSIINASGAQSSFVIANNRTRWAFFGVGDSAEFDPIKWIPPRHIELPNIYQLVWGYLVAVGENIASIPGSIRNIVAWDLTQESDATKKLKERLAKRFGPRETTGAYVFPRDGVYDLNTTGYARNLAAGTPEIRYTLSMYMTLFTEMVIPVISMVSEIPVDENFDGVDNSGLLECSHRHESFLTNLTLKVYNQIQTEPNNAKGWLNIFALDLLFDRNAYSLAWCIAPSSFRFAARADFILTQLGKKFGGAPEFVNTLLSSAEAGTNVLLLVKDFLDEGLASQDFYQATVGALGTPLNTIQFPDSNLSQCVNEAAAAQGWQTVEQVTALACMGRTISSLAGLEYFKNLRTLDLSGNSLTDISPLGKLSQLERLVLTGNNGIRCVELDGLAAALSSTAIDRPADCIQQSGNFVTQVKFETTQGDFVLKLDKSKAPVTVANFLTYVKEGFYDGTIFHRVIPGFMAQGGGWTGDFKQKPTHAPIKNEADNGLLNKRGTIAMARTSVPNSATAQFFINFIDNNFLNYKSPTPQGWGYAVFGEVVEGMDVVDGFGKIPTGPGGPFIIDLPKTPIVINKATVISE